MKHNGKKVFRSFAELREHFFPNQTKRERARTEAETILDEANPFQDTDKYDRLGSKRRLAQDDEELMREMGDSND